LAQQKKATFATPDTEVSHPVAVCLVSLTPPKQQHKMHGQLLRNHDNYSPQPRNHDKAATNILQSAQQKATPVGGLADMHCLLGAFECKEEKKKNR
jgi:hypothetical protein